MDSLFWSFAGTGLALYFFRNWVITHIQQSVKLKYDKELEILKQGLVSSNNRDLESYKHEISQMLSVLSTGNKAYSDSANLYQKRKLKSISYLWKRMLQIRCKIPPMFIILDALTSDEFQKDVQKVYEKYTQHTGLLDNQNVFDKMGFSSDHFDEEVRIFVGEYIWFIFQSYTIIHSRLIVQYLFKIDWSKIKPWYEDQVSLKVLYSILSSDEKKEFESLKFGKLQYVQKKIEFRYLSASESLLSGSAAGTHAVEQASRMAAAVYEAQIQSSKPQN